jgi:hypothetical protein
MSGLGSRPTLTSLWAHYAEQLPTEADERVMSAQKFAWWAGVLAALGLMTELENDESLSQEEMDTAYSAIHKEAQIYVDETLGPLAAKLRGWGGIR